MKEMSNFDIENLFKNDKHFGGVYSRDDVPFLEDKGYIINMDSKNNSGTHWVMVCNLFKNEVYYFDSFGAPPPEEVLEKLKETKKQIIINDLSVQRLNSSSCGEFCCLVLKLLKEGHSFSKIIINLNEEKLQRLFKDL